MSKELLWLAAVLAIGTVFLFIAKKKGKLRFAYVALTLIALPLGMLAVLLSKPDEDAEDQTDPSLVAKIGIGLFPLWASIVFTLVEGNSEQTSAYWNVAPWAIVLSIPICCATLMALDIGLRIWSKKSRS